MLHSKIKIYESVGSIIFKHAALESIGPEDEGIIYVSL
jgi:hypothetical protein